MFTKVVAFKRLVSSYLLKFFFVLTALVGIQNTAKGAGLNDDPNPPFNSETFYALSDWDFFKAVCNTNDPYYDSIQKWSQERGSRIKVIQRLDAFLTKMNDRISCNDYGFFSAGFDEIKMVEAKLELDSVNKQDIRHNLRFKIDSLYIVGMNHLILKCNLGVGFGEALNYREYLSYVRDYSNLQRMYITFKQYYNTFETSGGASLHISAYDIAQQLEAIAERVHDVEEQQFSMYRTHSAAAQKLKAFNLNHGNDFLATPLLHNQDQEMTGNFRFEFSTDKFKARWLDLGWIGSGIFGESKNAAYRAHKLKNPKYEMLSYQNISLGGDGYTPYIRYLNNTILADTLHQNDRPFGSYVYLERRKFRLWPKGLIRQNGTFQIGMIGLMTGQFLQAQLHKDAVTESQKVYGWEKQVGNGGRVLMQLCQEVDVMLYSSTNKYSSLFALNKPQTSKRRRTSNLGMQNAFGDLPRAYAGFNLSANMNVQYGGYLTALTTGLTVSSLDFLHQSGHIAVVSRRKNQFNFGWHVEASMKYRYVVHNTMLEGLGYTKTFAPDDYDDENSSIYVLSKTVVNRHLWLAEFKAVLQWRKMTMYYKLNLSRVEYTLPKVDLNSPEIMAIVNDHTANEDPNFYNYFTQNIRPEFERAQSRKFYGYGVVGVTWMFD